MRFAKVFHNVCTFDDYQNNSRGILESVMEGDTKINFEARDVNMSLVLAWYREKYIRKLFD